jgi:hypothetical protein
MRITALAAIVLCLAGCFLFNNPYDTSSPPAVTFQIVINSLSYAGTYVWNPTHSAYEATVGGLPYYVLMDGSGFWCLASALGQNSSTAIDYTPSPVYRGLPITYGPSWHITTLITSVDDSAGGISTTLKPPDGTVSVGDILQVGFSSTIPGVGALYQWQGSSNVGMTSSVALGTGSTYHVLDSSHLWIRVTITPIDGTGKIIGPPVTSPPVHLT